MTQHETLIPTPARLGEQYQREIESRPAESLMEMYPIGYLFLQSRGALTQERINGFFQTEIGQRYQHIAEALSPDLRERTRELFQAVLELQSLRNERGEEGLQVPDADLIQSWALQFIHGDEFAQIAAPAFADWSTRLTEKPIPHIAQANDWIGQRVAEHLKSQGKTTGVRAVDLGAGTGATMLAVARGLQNEGIDFEPIRGVDLSDVLVQRAKGLFANEGLSDRLSIEVGNAVDWLQGQEDGSLDVITMVYAIHHLPYEQQRGLEELIFRKLKPGGLFAIADPTGRSRFNLENLDVREPEATAACFRPELIQVVGELEEVGYTVAYRNFQHEEVSTIVDEAKVDSTQQGDTLDQGTLGYALVARKPSVLTRR